MRDINRAGQVGFNEESKERRARNRESSAEILKSIGVEFESKNGGAHLVIRLPDRMIDFWPGTGTFIDRKTNYHGRGVFNLTKRMSKIKSRQNKESGLL